MKTNDGVELKHAVNLLEDIKKLLILGLVTHGVQGIYIADVLGVNKSTISRIVPARKIKQNGETES